MSSAVLTLLFCRLDSSSSSYCSSCIIPSSKYGKACSEKQEPTISKQIDTWNWCFVALLCVVGTGSVFFHICSVLVFLFEPFVLFGYPSIEPGWEISADIFLEPIRVPGASSSSRPYGMRTCIYVWLDGLLDGEKEKECCTPLNLNRTFEHLYSACVHMVGKLDS